MGRDDWWTGVTGRGTRGHTAREAVADEIDAADTETQTTQEQQQQQEQQDTENPVAGAGAAGAAGATEAASDPTVWPTCPWRVVRISHAQMGMLGPDAVQTTVVLHSETAATSGAMGIECQATLVLRLYGRERMHTYEYGRAYALPVTVPTETERLGRDPFPSEW